MNLSDINSISSAAHNFYAPASDVKALQVKTKAKGLSVQFAGQDQAHFYTWFWVRDHGIDAQSLDQATLQRKVDTFAIPADIAAIKVNFDEDSQLVVIDWNDGTSSVISSYVMASVVELNAGRHFLVPDRKRLFWDKESPLTKIPTVEFDAVMASDEGLLEWLENIHVYGFSLVTGVPTTEQDTTRLAERIGIVQETIFGRMWPLSSELKDHGDTAYTDMYLEPHTDGIYYHDAAGLQMFNCLEFNCKGGESIQVDAFAIAQRIKAEDPDAYLTLTEVLVPGHYMEEGVHLRAERPVFRLDSKGELVQVSFNNYDRAPSLLSDDLSKRFFHAYGLFHKHAIDQDNWLKIPLAPGTTLIFDNWRNMHGRMGFVGKRVFYGCYHSNAVFESKIRILQANR